MRTTAVILVIVAGCGFPKPADVGGDGGPGSDATDAQIDAPDAPPPQCDIIAQTGCSGTEKCTFIKDTDTPISGHIACVQNGTVGNKGACTFSGGVVGFDNCVRGSYCIGGACASLCSQSANPQCGGNGDCLANTDLPTPNGTCNMYCNPLDDNQFKLGTAKPGTVCSASQGCYGIPSSDPARPTKFFCANDLHINNRVVHRNACDSASSCANAANNPYLNGCTQGYMPLLHDTNFSTTVVCIAMCKPANCYQGVCASGANAPGVAPHACNTTNADGTFDTASATNNGDHCMYSWWFEQDTQFVRSATSDTVGFCLNHKKYKYDSNMDGMVDVNDADFPLCATSPLTTAIQFGCVNTTLAGLPFTGKSRVRPQVDLHLPEGWQAQAR